MFSLMAGQACAAMTRILVEATAHDDFVALIKQTMQGMVVGDPQSTSTEMGPLIRETARERVERYVAIGRAEGGVTICGGQRPTALEKGFFYEPTVFTGLDNSSRLAQEEIFGPVAMIIPFADDDEAVRIANDSAYGLSATVHTTDNRRAWEIAPADFRRGAWSSTAARQC